MAEGVLKLANRTLEELQRQQQTSMALVDRLNDQPGTSLLPPISRETRLDAGESVLERTNGMLEEMKAQHQAMTVLIDRFNDRLGTSPPRRTSREPNENPSQPERTPSVPSTTERPEDDQLQPPEPASLTPEQDAQLQRPTSLPGSSVLLPRASTLSRLRLFLGDPNAGFTCPEQGIALEHVLLGKTSVFLIGPTGMGKSAVFLIPAMAEREKMTIVLVPLSGLRYDFARRCTKLSVPCIEWSERQQREAAIVMVSPENAKKRDFSNWCTHNAHLGKISRIVVDEGHLLPCHQSFRECMSPSSSLVRIGKRTGLCSTHKR